MSRILTFFALLLTAALPIAAHADSFTYTFTLTQTNGGDIGVSDNHPAGSGSFTITTTNPASTTPGVGTYGFPSAGSVGTLNAIDFKIDGLDISLADAGINNAVVTFNSTGVSQITYSTGSGYAYNGATYYFNGNSGAPSYAFSGANGSIYSNGIINNIQLATVNGVSVSTAPEPSALILFGTGALGLAGFARRRFLS